jgi:hypothetical protein
MPRFVYAQPDTIRTRLCIKGPGVMTRTILAAAFALSACAQYPNAIAPITMPSGMYDATSCRAAQAEAASIAANLAALEARQREAVAGDAVGVFLIGVPVSSLTGGDVAGQIAAERGKALALETRLRRC